MFKLQEAYCLTILFKKIVLINPYGPLMEPTYLSWSQSGFYQESISSPPGVHQEYQDFIRTPDGVHQDVWGSVTYSIIPATQTQNFVKILNL